jgi:putative DNA primase/helicase
MFYDRQITITAGASRKAQVWKAQTMLWSELCVRVGTPVRSVETLAQYLALPKSKQDELKDVGGFVGGTFEGTKRRADKVKGRDIITLDFDNIPPEQTENVLRRIASLGCGYCVYSTRKHSAAKPRLRGLFPMDRNCAPDEYEPIARKLAQLIGIELCDPSTFQASRLMYYPSVSSDSQYVYVCEDKPFLAADGVLAMYGDWRDVSQWPEVPDAPGVRKRLAAKQGDPEQKSGVVGAFCRTYNVYTVMDKFIPGVYVHTQKGDRFTYAEGSTSGGAVVYEDGKFLYSNHATDPAGGRLCNAFDLVRCHRFGKLDDDAKEGTPTNRLPSYKAMCALAAADESVAFLINKERYDKANAEFSGAADDTVDWISKLAVHPETGKPLKTVDNVLIILQNDLRLRGKIAYDEFSYQVLVLGGLPWNSCEDRRRWNDTDDAGLRHYLEKTYAITGKDRIYDACALAAKEQSIDDVRDYLESLEWDGEKRLETLFVDYLGAADTPYTRAVTRKAFAAAVARAMSPGCKYDCMPILSGPQGIGKSTLLKLIGRGWFSESLETFEGKEAAEMIRGVWINEIGELSGMNRSEMSSVKQFLSKVEDIYREPFGRRTAAFPRRCVFFGTTNDSEYLRDRTGNRRFLPVDCAVNPPVKSVFTQLKDEVDMLWAEAATYWRLGEKLYLEGDAARAAENQQEIHKEINAKEGVIRAFVMRRVPQDWQKRSLAQRKLYWANEFGQQQEGLANREKICALEIWCECFGGDIRYMKKSDAREINDILSSMNELKKSEKPLRFGADYGLQRGYIWRKDEYLNGK